MTPHERLHISFPGPARAAITATIGAAIVFLFSAYGSYAQERVGQANLVVNSVTGSGVAGERTLVRTDPVFRNENVSAAAGSRGELLLSDDSRIIVGENSSITLDEFVIDTDSFSKGAISVARGAFRFISGRSGEAIRINTPLATIGVRGTIVDLFVRDLVTKALVLNGQIVVCTRTSPVECELSRRACDIIEVTPDGIRRAGFLLSNERTFEQETEEFPLAVFQNQHSDGWRAQIVGCSGRAAAQSQGNPDNSPSPTPSDQAPPTDVDID